MKNNKIVVPELPESVSNAIILKWHKTCGEKVKINEVVADIETDKIILEISSPIDGILKNQYFFEGNSVKTNDILGSVDSFIKEEEIEKKDSKKKIISSLNKNYIDYDKNYFSPTQRRLSKTSQFIDKNKKNNDDKKILSGVNSSISEKNKSIFLCDNEKKRNITRVAMSPIRKTISERLLYTKKNTAMLTTFNEVNMEHIISIRKKYGEIFKEKYNIRLGYMSFYVKSVTKALKLFPEINASIENNDIIYHNYYDISIAISTPRGLITPVLRNSDTISIDQIEKKIKQFSDKSISGKIKLEDLQGGTFTISNGGVFGSLMSTPIINPPQVAILGVHNIYKRPIVLNDAIVSASMMYLALSYDHRLIDGKQAILFLKKIKEYLEDSSRIFLDI